MKTLKSNFGNLMVISFMKLQSVFDLFQIYNKNLSRLRTFLQQLKSVITCINSMGDNFTTDLIENIMKVITRLAKSLQSKFHRYFKDANVSNKSSNKAWK